MKNEVIIGLHITIGLIHIDGCEKMPSWFFSQVASWLYHKISCHLPCLYYRGKITNLFLSL